MMHLTEDEVGRLRRWRPARVWVILVTMKKMSLAEAKAHISELVDQAEHHGKRTLILRHGKPAAAIVPVDVATPKPPAARKAMDAEAARRSVEAFVAEFSAAEPAVSAVQDLLAGRR
jgi:prevent-host-death family protein